MLPQPYDWVLRFTLELWLFLVLVFFLLRPLWKLAASRPALFIVFSRAIANFLRLLADFPNFVLIYMLKTKLPPPWDAVYMYGLNSFVRCLECSLHMHNLALAINRAHGIWFPFHYQSFYASKRRPYLTCLFLWLLAMCFGIPDPIIRDWIRLYLSPDNTVISISDSVNKVCMVTAGLFYVALGGRMLWNQYKSSSMAGTTSEKDSIRILMICMTCLFMSSIRMVFLNVMPNSIWSVWPDVPKTIFYWVSYGMNWLAFCTEEILLAFLVADFRKNVKQQISAVLFCSCYKSSNSSQTRTMPRSITVDSLVRGVR